MKAIQSFTALVNIKASNRRIERTHIENAPLYLNVKNHSIVSGVQPVRTLHESK